MSVVLRSPAPRHGILGLSCAREDFLANYFAERQDYDRGTADCAEYWRRVARVSGAELHEDDIPTLEVE